MRILKIFDGDYPWDVRVEKVSRTLMAAGHDLLLVCRNKAGHAPRKEILEDGLRVERVPALGPAGLSLPIFLSPLWIAPVLSAARRFKPDIVLVRDLPMAPLGLLAGQLRGVPVLADLAEPYPDSLRSIYQFNEPSMIDRFVRNPRVADAVEQFVVKRLDHALVVCPEAQGRLESVGLPEGRCTVVRNTPHPDSLVRLGKEPDALKGLQDCFVVLFSGLLAGDRGLDVAIDAIEALDAQSPNRFALVIVGDGPVAPRLKEQVREKGLGDVVRFIGQVPYQNLADIIAGCDLGILPFHHCPHIEASLANKLFEYMSLGLPVVASDVAPHRRVIDHAGNGLLTRPGSASELAAAIRVCEQEASRLRAFAEAGRQAVASGYSWSEDAARLLEAVSRFSVGEGSHSHPVSETSIAVETETPSSVGD